MSLDMIQEGLQQFAMPIDDVLIPERAMRVHTKKTRRMLAHSIEKFGQTKPIVLDADGFICAGHAVLDVMKDLKSTHIAAVTIEASGEEAAMYEVFDNRSGDKDVGSEWNWKVLSELEEESDDSFWQGLEWSKSESRRIDSEKLEEALENTFTGGGQSEPKKKYRTIQCPRCGGEAAKEEIG